MVAAALVSISLGQAPTASAATATGATWFAPYVDATLPPMYQVQDPALDPAHQSVFGFIVASRQSPCTPSWGDYYSLSQAAGPPMSLSKVISAMHQEGEQPVISFGGEDNTPLADACTNVGALEEAYSEVASTYGATTLDFDIEGAAQGDVAALTRQAQALHSLQAQEAAQGKKLGIWLTLPVTTAGMLPVAENVVDIMLNGGVALSGVNLMTMYFWPSPGDGAPMLGAVVSALKASEAQLAQIFSAHGIKLTTPEVWAHMGATVQIGQASVPGQAFTVADAQGLVAFAEQVGLGRVSMWSINQDTPCGSASHPQIGGYSNYCSGVAQEPLAFDNTFSALGALASSTSLVGAAQQSSTAPGPPSTSAPASTTTAPTVTTTTPTTAPTTSTTTAMATSPPPTTTSTTTTLASPGPTASTTPVPALGGPYAPWSADLAYPGGSEATYDGLVFEAKWWNQGEAPTADPAEPWDTPWQVVGPVPAGYSPPAGPAQWSPELGYPSGSEVTYDGLAFKAKWWTRGEAPVAHPADPWDTPWELL